MMKLMFNTLSADDITAATQGRNYAESPGDWLSGI